jgi:tetratricopeptide (TPR) repeat protein
MRKASSFNVHRAPKGFVHPQQAGSSKLTALLAEGLARQQAGRLADAEKIYNHILAVWPDHFDSRHLLGVIFLQRDKYAEALRHIDLALKKNPNNAPALNNRGVALKGLDRIEEALLSFERAVSLQAHYADALSNRGDALHKLKRFAEALTSCDRAIALRPDFAEAHSNRANALHALNRFEESLVSCDRAIALRPDFAEAHTNRGNTLHDLCRFEEALASHDRALALRPDFAEAHSNRGNTLQELKRFEEALAGYDRAIMLRPDFAEAYSNRGNAQREVNRFEEALASFDRAIALRPDFAEAHFSAALCLLLTGELTRGWQRYEWRWETDQLKNETRNFVQPQWMGSEEIAGKTILIYAEQGFGDTIHFCRYIPRIAERAGRVIFEVQKPLRELMSTLAGGAQIIARGDALPDFDICCPLLSLPLAFGTRLDTIPPETPYLFATETKKKAWRDRIGTRNGPRIGLVWAGDPRKWLPNAHRIDRQRSIEFDRLAPLFEITGCEFYSLQKGEHAVTQLRHSPRRHRVIDWTNELDDFSDTAALIDNLDLIVAVDTSVAHLAGALGKPLWLLNRYNTCWRWLLDRTDSPWYPTAHLFRQDETRDWDQVIAAVADALQDQVRRLASNSEIPATRQ